MKSILILCVLASCSHCTFASESFWPNGAEAAVSLAYDDALNSHLDVAIPQLDKYGFKASFYLTLAAPVVSERLEEWRAVARNGHELGNHTIHHGCSKSRLRSPAWLHNWNDLDQRSITELQAEVLTANAFLKAIDGQDKRTFTAPCGHWQVSDGNYHDAIKSEFVAIKAVLSYEPQVLGNIDPHHVHVAAAPESVTSDLLVEFVEKAAQKGSIANITFHGVGGDHLAISATEHQKFMDYLNNNKERFWVDSFVNIMTHYNTKREER